MLRGGSSAVPRKKGAAPPPPGNPYPSPSPIYVDIQTARQGGNTAATPTTARQHGTTMNGGLSDPTIGTFALSNLQPFRLGGVVTKEMRLMLEAAENDMRDDRQSATVDLQDCNLRQLYDRLCLVHFGQGGGPLRPGGAVQLWSKSHAGLLVSSLFVGVMFGAFPALVLHDEERYARVATVAPLLAPFYPIFSIHTSFMLFPASLRFVMGLVTDLVPLVGYRRKSYMVAGWLVGALFVLVAAIVVGVFDQSSDVLVPLLLGACIGVSMADVAGEGLLVEWAQRESLVERGRLQALVVGTKFLGTALAQVYLAFLEGGNTKEWTSDDTIRKALFFSLAMLALVPIPFVIYVVAEPPTVKVAPLVDRCLGLWQLLQSKAVASILAFSFAFSMAVHAGAGTTSSFKRDVLDVLVERTWLHAPHADLAPRDPLLVTAAGVLAFSLPMLLGASHLAKCSWTHTMYWTTLAVGVVGALHTSFTTYDTCRHPWFWYGALLLLQIPSGIRFLVSLFPIVELATVGYEATLYSLVVSVQLAAIPVSTALFSVMEAPLREANWRGQFLVNGSIVAEKWTDVVNLFQNNPATQSSVAHVYSYGVLIGFATLVSLVWLPSQKIDAQVWRKFGGASRRVGVVVVCVWWVLLTGLLVVGMLNTNPSSWSCSPVLGGRGCA
ncbi:Aste57867_9785 [Aphanomyces stellatus]|uniref:Aste57867_9785 protein n=1 Tax=Aphanomyces stellatus TaxID=120398 RepID=A0A485KPE7_9STRA|nr:hypothetical protein As57867_009746 [Aphanomyces stellatus]VFT86664.1 Aste57867_9785 [Aphanomyces stellatus]